MDFFMHPGFMVAGGIAVASPILIHLINRMRFKRIRWAAMEFLLKSQKRNRRRLIIEQLILLLLRILLVLLAGFLLARYLYSGAADQGGTHHVVILDDSLSMTDHWTDTSQKFRTSFGKGKDELLRVAKEAAKANSAQVMTVYLLSDTNEPIFNDTLNDTTLKNLQQTLDKRNATVLHLKPKDGINAAREALVTGPHRAKIMHYIGDFRQNKWVDGEDGKETMEAIDSSVGKGINVSLLDVAHPKRSDTRGIADGHNNLAIVDLRADSRIVAEGLPVEFTVKLKNYGTSARTGNMKLHVYVDGVEDFTGTKLITETIPAGEDRLEKFTLYFAKKKPAQDIRAGDAPDVREQKRRAEQEFFHVRATLSDGDNKFEEPVGLVADKFRDMVVEVRKKVPVLVIDGNDGSEGTAPKGDVFQLDVALYANRAYEVERRVMEDLEKINLDLYPTVYLVNVKEIKGADEEKTAKLVKKLADYVRGGGSVAYFVGPKLSVPFYNKVLHQENKGLFPVMLQAAPVPPLDEKERERRLKEDEQPKILFRIPALDTKDPTVPTTKPESIVINLASNQGYFRYLLIDRYWPTLPRFQWYNDRDEPVQDVISLPNSKEIQEINPQANALMREAQTLADQLADQDGKFKPHAEAIKFIYKKGLSEAQSSGYLFKVASVFDHMLNDIADPKDEKRPDMRALWGQPTLLALRERIKDEVKQLRYGDPLVVARNYGKGHVVACLTTAGTATKWNDWAEGGQMQWSFPVFIGDMQRYLTSTGDELNHFVGDKIELKLDATRFKNRYKMSRKLQADPEKKPGAPDEADKTDKEDKPLEAGETDFPLPEVTGPKGNQLEFKFDSTKQAGWYEFTFTQLPSEDKELRAYAFNVMADPESDLRRAPTDKLVRTQANAGNDLLAGNKPKVTLRQMDDNFEEFQAKAPDASESPWLYLLILVILVVEQALAVHLSFHLRGDTTAAPAPGALPAALPGQA
jgi:hypothetical protein